MPRDKEKKDDFSIRFISKVGRSLSNEFGLNSGSKELGIKRGKKGLLWVRPSRSKNKRYSLGASDGSTEDGRKDEFEDAKEDAADDAGKKDDATADGEGKADEAGKDDTKAAEEAEGSSKKDDGGETKEGESSIKKKDETDSKADKEPTSILRRGRRDSFLIKLTDDQKKKLRFTPF